MFITVIALCYRNVFFSFRMICCSDSTDSANLQAVPGPSIPLPQHPSITLLRENGFEQQVFSLFFLSVVTFTQVLDRLFLFVEVVENNLPNLGYAESNSD